MNNETGQMNKDFKHTNEKTSDGPFPSDRLRLSLMGSEGSGKTCFFAGLAWLGGATQDGRFGVIGRDEASQRYVKNLRDTITRGEWPQANRGTVELNLDVLYERARIGIDIEDFAGEEFRNVGSELKADGHLFKQLVASRYLVLFLDIENDVERDAANNAERLDAVLNLLSREELCNGSRKLAVVLTKSDLRGFTGSNATSAAARKHLKKWKPALLRKIEDLGYEKKFFFLAPIGRSSLSGGKQPAPFGYDNLFEWLVNDLQTERWMKWIRRYWVSVSAACIVFVLAIAFGIGQYFCHKNAAEVLRDSASSEEQIERALEWAPQKDRDLFFDREISEIGKTLSSVDSLSTLGDLQNKIGKWKGKGSAPIEQRLVDLEEKIQDRREDIRIKQISDLSREEHDDIPRCKEAIGDYYSDINCSHRRADEVKAIDARLDANVRESGKAEIRCVVVSIDRPDSLRQKCDLIEKFAFPDERTKKEATRAVAIGRMFLADSPYRVTIKSASGLPTAHRTRLELSINGPGSMPQDKSTEHLTSTNPQWNKTIDLHWKPRYRITISWLWKSRWGVTATTIGKKTFDHPWTSLLDILPGGVALDPETGMFHARLGGNTPRVTLTCDQFPDPANDKRLFERYIVPGTYWNQQQ